ncbi:MAG: hypothetical protein ACLVHQ_01395 [Oscillospiraceae bacterium]
MVNEFVKKIIVYTPDKPADTADRRLNLSGTLSGNWNRTDKQTIER